MKPVNPAEPWRKPARRDHRGRARSRVVKSAGLSATPLPGSRPVTVRREVPVTVLSDGAGGRQVVNHDTDEPCYSCPCCVLWSRSLDELGPAIRAHHDEEHGRRRPCSDYAEHCLVCAILTGGLENG